MPFADRALFLGDALASLERLPSEEVTLAYLDPPALTGYPKGQDHQRYIDYLSRVIQQINRILNPVGSLYVYCPPSSQLDMRLMVGQVFGRPATSEITWPRKRNVRAYAQPIVDGDTLLVFGKTGQPIYNKLYRPLNDEERQRYNHNDERGPFRLNDLTAFSSGDGPRAPWRGYQLPPTRSWRFTFERLEVLAGERRIHIPTGGGFPSMKGYLHEAAPVEIGATWEDIPPRVVGGERRDYPGQQPLALMERIVRIASNEQDLVLDPFFGTGTTLVAAQSLGRRWWGVDDSEAAQEITMQRLRGQNELIAGTDYTAYAMTSIQELPVVAADYRKIVGHIAEIADLQNQVANLSHGLLRLKTLLNLEDDDDPERTESVIAALEERITLGIENQPKMAESYVSVVRDWLSGWDRLDDASRTFLLQAELFFESIPITNGQDYSMFVLQYCRALENELLTKLFTAYTNDLYARYPDDPTNFLNDDLKSKDRNTNKFASRLKKRFVEYTLGEMSLNMKMLGSDNELLTKSVLWSDFRRFVLHYFSENIVERDYLNQIETITRDYRNKAAHPNVLSREIGLKCRELLRSCLNEFILNYKNQAAETEGPRLSAGNSEQQLSRQLATGRE